MAGYAKNAFVGSLIKGDAVGAARIVLRSAALKVAVCVWKLRTVGTGVDIGEELPPC